MRASVAGRRFLLILLSLGVAAFPYGFFLVPQLACLRGLPNSTQLSWSIVALIWLVGLGCGICLERLGKRKIWPADNVAFAVYMIKFFQVPMYGISLLASVVLMAFLFVPVMSFVICALTIILSGLAGRAAVSCCQAEGVITEEEAQLLKKRMFYFFLDVAAADKLHEKAKRDEASNENGN